MTRHTSVHDLAMGKWPGILKSFGVPDNSLNGKHGPCPMCGGTDRFRFDNKDGRGTWICNACGAGTGVDLAMTFKGWNFKTAVQEIEAICGHTAAEAVKPQMTEEKRLELLRSLWVASKPIAAGDESDCYLRLRGIEHDYPKALRTAPACRYAEGVSHPAMLGVVSDASGKEISLHRTFLQSGSDKAIAKKIMPGTLPDGAAIRLGPACEAMGIAEGIETALSASMLFEVPVWSAISTSLLKSWNPPECVRELVICADNDPRFGGLAAGYALAHRLATQPATREIEIIVRVPPDPGSDWNDVLTGRRPQPIPSQESPQ